MRTVNRPECCTPRLLLVVILLSAFFAPACHKESPTGTDEQSTPSSEIRAIDARVRRTVVAELASSLRENYFDVRAAEVMATKIESRLADGDYDAIDDAHSFAVRLEKDLHAISDDRHLLVTFCDRPAKPARPRASITTVSRTSNSTMVTSVMSRFSPWLAALGLAMPPRKPWLVSRRLEP